MELDRDKCVLDGILVGLLLPGIAQMIAQRLAEGIIWLIVTIAAWAYLGPWALLLHLASASRCARIMGDSFDLLTRRAP